MCMSVFPACVHVVSGMYLKRSEDVRSLGAGVVSHHVEARN